MLGFHTEPTLADRGPEDAAARMGRAVHTLAHGVGLTAADIARVGLGTPGPQDLPAGIILRAGNLPGWDGFPVRDRVAVHCGRPVTYANDATAAAYGEFWVGSGREESTMMWPHSEAWLWAPSRESPSLTMPPPTPVPSVSRIRLS
ncbi:MAG: ROK family protein [Planctomycetia bacterium]